MSPLTTLHSSIYRRAPYSNYQVNFYNSSNAYTRDGKLEIWSVNEDVTFMANGSHQTRHLQTAMLQTWNKFCFQEGAVDVSARMPGVSTQPGLGLSQAWSVGTLQPGLTLFCSLLCALRSLLFSLRSALCGAV